MEDFYSIFVEALKEANHFLPVNEKINLKFEVVSSKPSSAFGITPTEAWVQSQSPSPRIDLALYEEKIIVYLEKTLSFTGSNNTSINIILKKPLTENSMMFFQNESRLQKSAFKEFLIFCMYKYFKSLADDERTKYFSFNS